MPSPMDWYRNFMASPQMSDATKQAYPQMDLAWNEMQSQMPKQAAGVNQIRPMNALERAMFYNANAMTYPNRTIAFNPDQMQYLQQQGLRPDDLLAHELTHVGQYQQNGMLPMLYRMVMAPDDYMSRDYEQQAFQTEAKRKAARRDIPLPPEKVNGSRKNPKATRTARRGTR